MPQDSPVTPGSSSRLITLGVSLALLVCLTFLVIYGKTGANANTPIGILSAIGITTEAMKATLKTSVQAAVSRVAPGPARTLRR